VCGSSARIVAIVRGRLAMSAADSGGSITFRGAGPVVPSTLRLGGAAAVALVAKSVAMARDLAPSRGRGAGQRGRSAGRSAPVVPDVRQAVGTAERARPRNDGDSGRRTGHGLPPDGRRPLDDAGQPLPQAQRGGPAAAGHARRPFGRRRGHRRMAGARPGTGRRGGRGGTADAAHHCRTGRRASLPAGSGRNAADHGRADR
jgi:hypothetical protein